MIVRAKSMPPLPASKPAADPDSPRAVYVFSDDTPARAKEYGVMAYVEDWLKGADIPVMYFRYWYSRHVPDWGPSPVVGGELVRAALWLVRLFVDFRLTVASQSPMNSFKMLSSVRGFLEGMLRGDRLKMLSGFDFAPDDTPGVYEAVLAAVVVAVCCFLMDNPYAITMANSMDALYFGVTPGKPLYNGMCSCRGVQTPEYARPPEKLMEVDCAVRSVAGEYTEQLMGGMCMLGVSYVNAARDKVAL